MAAILITSALNEKSTQTEDEGYIGKGKTFGNYTGKGIIIPEVDRKIKQVDVQQIISVKVLNACCDTSLTSITLKKDDGTIVTVGTRDFGFTVPKNIVGRYITIEGENTSGGRKRRDYQKDIQFAATGIKVLD